MKKIIYPITTLVIVFAGPVLLQSFSNKNNMPVGEIYVVTTLAGYSDKGLQVDGKGDKAGFSSSVGNLFATADGNVFVMDQGTLRKIDPDGKVTSLLGLIAFDAEGNQLKLEALKGPDGICLDKAGNMYVSDGNGNMIYKINCR